MKGITADYQNNTQDSKLGFYAQGWVPLEASNCNAKDANRVQESIFNWHTKDRNVKG